ncbi:N-acetylmuramoyl-L-alanine amidase [Pullulanibacillus pueri]|uniref:Germination-specific N-acetylmuramoyl-L-alanine amidase n=1 Tax=Pullulanibacillus pueri TaxID=1437324 RepID=A0A8J2ZXJ0_9BACL|nr:N-acetylmuramoyl-L-alanine amidase CwlD [Pullulanibacillus pueri]MBM7683097.1 N-acetylmuramoyl-L-alanine amidase [Pullulanibacillus pueri]GGH85274.1 germination-specific N-acetylmuramoyl-L-alanine amidase [Pullulanibacillus pueri]
MQGRLKKAVIILGVLLLILIINYEVITRHSWDQWHLPLAGRIIVLDPGHGGADGGAESGDVQEDDIALEITKKLRDYLQEAGALVIMTREKDKDLADEGLKGLSKRKSQDLQRRVEIINHSDADMFVSIHLNKIPASQWHGAQTFYHPKSEDNKKLASFIQDSLRKNLENTDRLAKEIGHIYLLKQSKVPSSLVEVGFLSNPSEKQLLVQNDYQNKIAESIYNGILRYYTKEKEPAS